MRTPPFPPPQVGYRWYDSHNVAPAFEFGLGLSYTTFSYSDVQVSKSGVSFTLKNTGSRDGAATPQLYLGFPASAGEPPKQLKGGRKYFFFSSCGRSCFCGDVFSFFSPSPLMQ